MEPDDLYPPEALEWADRVHDDWSDETRLVRLTETWGLEWWEEDDHEPTV